LVGTPPLLRAASFYAALPSTTAAATAIIATAVVIAAALKAEVTAADRTRKLALVPPSRGGRTAAPRDGSASSAFVFLPVSAGLLITLFVGGWHAIRYYVWEPPNIHHGTYHATILTILHAGLRQVPGALARQPQRHHASPVLRDRIPKIGEGRMGEVRITRLLRGWVSKVEKKGRSGEGDALTNARRAGTRLGVPARRMR
jgi:hypothetical protein